MLYFTNAHEPNNQKNYWYFDIKNIGYTLDSHRRKIKGKNDLNKLAESDFKRAETKEGVKENMLEIGFEVVDLEKVKRMIMILEENCIEKFCIIQIIILYH